MALASLAEMRTDIERERRNVGKKQFSHNFISMTLVCIDKHYGREEANRAIRDFKLKELGWSEE